MAPRKEAALDLVASRIRDIHAEVLRLCPPDTRRNVRVSTPEARDNYALVRLSHVDALDVAKLSARFPGVCMCVRDGVSGACLDVYIPYRRSILAAVLRGTSICAYLVAASAISFGLLGRNVF
jgi:hypothetical protein